MAPVLASWRAGQAGTEGLREDSGMDLARADVGALES